MNQGNNINASHLRANLIEFVRRDLVGPAHGENEVLDDPPKLRYAAGVLFPRESERNESAAAAGVEEDESSQHSSSDGQDLESIEPAGSPAESNRSEILDSEYDDVVTLANSYRPSAVSLTFMVSGKQPLVIEARAAIYAGTAVTSPDGARQFTNWIRQPLTLQSVTATISATQDVFLNPGLALRIVCRPRPRGLTLVTVSLFNTTHNNQHDARTFFQAGFSVRRDDLSKTFVEYRSRTAEVTGDRESNTLALLYRNRRIFAVGHGCAADWADTDADSTTKVWTQEVPAVLVPPIIPRASEERCSSMSFLADEENDSDEVCTELLGFCAKYEAWLADRIVESKQLPSYFHTPAQQNLALCRVALERMKAGVSTLRGNPSALKAFRLVNRAMLTQQINSRRRRKINDTWMKIDVRKYAAEVNTGIGYWRAFQLAFILITISGIVDEAAPLQLPDGTIVNSHDLVDLIWFPTGGGKTEAYLALTAFVVFLGRLTNQDPEGCKVLMRYTLRLLTSQQFQRAASLICACEEIRRLNEGDLGTLPISIGLWVGQSLTPNDEKEALKKLALLSRKKEGSKNPFQLLSCPWCGTELNNPARLGYAELNGRQVFVCPARECEFGRLGRHLPVCIVDETLYSNPATLLIATVDKFAMLAWRERAGGLLTIGGGPDLIIQDELHLISGPLGSMVGLYETAIDYLSRTSGKSPKIVASTATIRRADQQCLALYNRRMLQFPPPALDASDSFFAREDRSSPGRIYVGFLPSAASSPLTAQIRSVVALMQGLLTVSGTETEETGKELAARAIHYAGPLRGKPFIPIDCGSLVPTLIESELFGYAKGAFTGATQAKQGLLAFAEGGTVFLDEVGELAIDLQAKLLRALQEKEIRPVGATQTVPINVRILAATNRDLEEAVAGGTFRRDLYFRLNVLNLRIPPLRERRQDILVLANHLLDRISRNCGKTYELSENAMQALAAYDWPGNVRELENCLEQCCAMNSGPVIHASDLPGHLMGRSTVASATVGGISRIADLEREAIMRAITQLNGDKLMAARLLGIGKTTLYRKLKQYEGLQ